MTEIQEIYSDLISKMNIITDTEAIIRVDASLTNLENSFNELLEGTDIYGECFSDNLSTKANICVLGANGHGIAHYLRNRFLKSFIAWIPNINLFKEDYINSFHVLIITDMAINDLLTDHPVSLQWKSIIKDEGYLIINYNNIVIDHLIKWLNSCYFTPIKLFDQNIISAINSKFMQSEAETNSHNKYTKYKTVYCICPSLVKSGGPELLHQLVYWINKLGGDAEIAYMDCLENKGFTNPEYSHYVAGHVTRFEAINDTANNALVIPEGWPFVCADILYAKIIFWWLSVDNFFIPAGSYVDDTIELVKTKSHIHLFQSEYAKQYVLSLGITQKSLYHLSDYINDEYLTTEANYHNCEKKDIVLYNPKKGHSFTEELIRRSKDIEWVAIQNMTTTQVADLMKRAKIYVDFGNHPGKDRIPREAAISGCIVITGRKGSAAYFEDVPIPEIYKINDENVSPDEITDFIRSCLRNYDKMINDFSDYRSRILCEKDTFIEDIKNVFF